MTKLSVLFSTFSAFFSVLLMLSSLEKVAAEKAKPKSHWKYKDEEHWPKLCKEGKQQSPIALADTGAEKKDFVGFVFQNYGGEFAAHLTNNGHSIEIKFRVPDQPTVRGGGLPEVYVLDHLHFHWQSEHTVNDYRYPLELHMVHYANTYANLSEALQHPNAVAVFAVLFDYSPDDDQEFEPLVHVIEKLHDRVDEVTPMIFKMFNFVPRDTSGFYRYVGSLTTPACTEGLIWTVFTNTLPISETQVKSFETILNADKKALPQTYRSLQKLHKRKVYLKVSPIHKHGNDGIVSKSENLFLLLLVVTILFFQRFN